MITTLFTRTRLAGSQSLCLQDMAAGQHGGVCNTPAQLHCTPRPRAGLVQAPWLLWKWCEKHTIKTLTTKRASIHSLLSSPFLFLPVNSPSVKHHEGAQVAVLQQQPGLLRALGIAGEVRCVRGGRVRRPASRAEVAVSGAGEQQVVRLHARATCKRGCTHRDISTGRVRCVQARSHLPVQGTDMAADMGPAGFLQGE